MLGQLFEGASGSVVVIGPGGGGGGPGNDNPTDVQPGGIFQTSPQSQSVTPGATVVLTCSAFAGWGGLVNFQWRKDGTNISGATGTTLQLNNVTIDAAGTYSVFGTVLGQNEISQPATLVVRASPAFREHPQSHNVRPGTNLLLSANAVGMAPLGFQWFRDGSLLAGATNASLSLTNVGRSAAGRYSIVVSNELGIVTSSNASVQIMVPQRIQSPVRVLDGRFRLVFGDHDGGILTAGDAAGFEVQVSTNFVNWIALTNSPGVTNGQLFVDDAEAQTAVRRFYRIIER